MTLVLASQSPRRRELLAQVNLSKVGLSFEQVSPDIDETPLADEDAATYVQRLAQEKALAGLALCQHIDNPQVLGSDTIVVFDGQLLGKPVDEADAATMLSRLSANHHVVMTAVALTDGVTTQCTLVQTRVTFCALTEADILAYIATGEPMDKAGAYGIQGLGGCFVTAIDGSYSAVVGLPLAQTRELLQQAGII